MYEKTKPRWDESRMLMDGMALVANIETVYMHFCEHVDGRLGKLKIPF